MAKVSIIIPNYNHERFLRARLRSVYEQTFRDFDVCILDDYSTDNSCAIIEDFEKTAPTRLLFNSQNSGNVFKQWAKGVSATTGKYIWIAESDDAASNHLLEELSRLLDDNPDCGIAYSQSWLINLTGEVLGTSTNWTDDLSATRWTKGFKNNGINEISQFLVHKNTIPNASAVLLRRDALMACGGVIDNGMRLCGDWLQWVRILSVSNIIYTPHRLNFWRQASSNARLKINGPLEWREGSEVIDACAHYANIGYDKQLDLQCRLATRCLEWANDSFDNLLNRFTVST